MCTGGTRSLNSPASSFAGQSAYRASSNSSSYIQQRVGPVELTGVPQGGLGSPVTGAPLPVPCTHCRIGGSGKNQLPNASQNNDPEQCNLSMVFVHSHTGHIRIRLIAPSALVSNRCQHVPPKFVLYQRDCQTAVAQRPRAPGCFEHFAAVAKNPLVGAETILSLRESPRGHFGPAFRRN